MRNGVYRVCFENAPTNSHGLMALKDGRITGCDKTHFKTGNYTVKDDRFTGEIFCQRHSHHSDGVFERDAFTIRFDGICSASYGQTEAQIAETPQARISATFNWLCAV